jgi:hypothetical protein
MKPTVFPFYTSLVLLAATTILNGCSFVLPPGSISTTVSPNTSDGSLSLQCQASSTDRCYFLVGEAFESIYEVKVGDSKSIPAPSGPLPFCVTNTLTYRTHCTKLTTIGPGSLVTFKWSNKS